MGQKTSAERSAHDAAHWTVQLMPEGSGRVRSFRVSRRVLRMLSLSGAIFLILVIGFFVNLGVQVAREAELLRLRAENDHLQRNLATIERQVQALGQSVDDLSAKDQRFRLLAGLPYLDEDVRAVGVGGPLVERGERSEFLELNPEVAERTYAAAYDADKLARRIDLLSTSIEEALDSAEVHRAIFLGRPSIRPVQAGESWISSSFSRNRFHPVLHVNRPHPGIDISALAGTPIVATARGTVTFAGTKPGYGKTIEIDHSFGYKTRYAHAGSIKVKRGQRVERGEVIGLVGKTGLATAPHVHYEVLVHGRQVNPRMYLLDDAIYE